MTTHNEQPIPDNIRSFDQREAEKLRQMFVADAYEDNGVLRWKSNNRAVPLSCFREAFCEASPHHVAVHDREQDAFIAEYVQRQKNRVYSDEERFEMRAAFGPGATVVNVFTGKKTKL